MSAPKFEFGGAPGLPPADVEDIARAAVRESERFGMSLPLAVFEEVESRCPFILDAYSVMRRGEATVYAYTIRAQVWHHLRQTGRAGEDSPEGLPDDIDGRRRPVLWRNA